MMNNDNNKYDYLLRILGFYFYLKLGTKFISTKFGKKTKNETEKRNKKKSQ